MALLNNAFTGKLNLDQQEYRVPEGDYIDALNITRDSVGNAKDTVVANIDGNQWVLYSLPLGVNKCIGQYADRLRNRVYMFIWNSIDHDVILYYDRATNTIVEIMENLDNTGGIDVLNFNPSFKILHTDIIYRDFDGDLLLWTDGYNPPREINVNIASSNPYTYIKDSYIELAKRPPLDPPTCVYGNDTNINANNLRRTLFQFTTRWQCDDFSKTTYSTFSKVPLPVGFYGSDNDIDNTNNNFIAVTVPTGDENVSKIEIAVRLSDGALWGDLVTAVILDKSALNIPDNDFYQYLFYNDNLYPPIPLAEQIQLFDWVPRTALGQVLANGSTPVYGAIREGYNNIAQNDLDVTITAENVKNIPPDASLPSLTYVQSATTAFTFTVGAQVNTGTRYQVYVYFNGTPPAQTRGVFLVGDYTATGADTASDVALALFNQFNSYSSVPTITGSQGGPNFTVNFGLAGTYILASTATGGTPGAGTISTEKTWLWDANYVFGIVYVDEQNRDMPGVTTFTAPTDSDNDFAVTTPSFSEDSGDPETPVISAEINHLPPAGAVAYYWVRRRATYGEFLQYLICDFQEDTDYYYFCLADVDFYKSLNSQFIYSTVPITSESRIKIIAGVSLNVYTGDTYNEDYLILGTVVRTLTGGSSPDNDKSFIKVKKPASAPSPVYTNGMLVQVYVPLRNPTTEEGAVFYEWGEKYAIYTGAGGIRYHEGMDQNQTASQPATFTWPEGDVYFHLRTMYTSLLTSGTNTVSLMDKNFSDFFLSGVNDDGRPQVIEANAQDAFLPALVRFGQSYQSDTTVNQINRFYFVNFDEYDRSNGTIRKLFIEGRSMYVFQTLDIGVVPVLTQIVKDSANNPLQANSDLLLNKIQYPYIGKYGIGDVPESFAYGKHAKYGIDNNKGVAWRLSQDGVTPLSILYQCNNFFVTQSERYSNVYNNGYPASGQEYTGNAGIYGVYNEYSNRVIWAFEEINRYDVDGNLIFHQAPKTITFNESRKSDEGFESFRSDYPEMYGCLNNLLFAFINGQFWKYEGGYYNNFFGQQYDSYITPVFNGKPGMKKTFEYITQYSNIVWSAPQILTQLDSFGGSKQESYLVPQDFRQKEGNYNAAFRRDINSLGGIVNGAPLRGNYISLKLLVSQPSTYVYLNGLVVSYIDSPKNPR